jgi:hypothetical protein
MRTRLVSLVACLVAIVVGPGIARGESRGVVIEVYTGDKPPEAERLITPVLEELQSRQFETGTALGGRFESEVSRPVLTPNGLPKDFEAVVNQAFKDTLQGLPTGKAAIVQAVETARKNPGAFVEAAKQDTLLKALVTLGIAQKGAGDMAAMKDAYRDLARSFPKGLVPRSVYGQEAAAQFAEALREIAAGQKQLVVAITGSPQGAVYVNESYRDLGSTVPVALAPGEYRVFAKFGQGQLSRSHRLVVGSETERLGLEIHAGFDLAVRTSGWTGLAFATAKDREQYEGAYARRFASSLKSVGVAIVGIGEVNGKRQVVGALINMLDGSDIRRGSVALDSSTKQLRELARFLAGDADVQGVTVLSTKPAPVDDSGTKIVEARHVDRGEPAASGGLSAGPWKWIAGSTAVGALGVAGVLLYYNGKCSQTVTGMLPCPDVYNYAVPGYLTLGAGAALAAVTVYLFVRNDRAPSRTAYVVPAQGGAVAGFLTSF